MGHKDDILAMLADGRVLRPTAVAKAVGCTLATVLKMARDAGPLQRVAGGVRLPNPDRVEPLGWERLAEIALRAPKAVLVGGAAGVFHDLADQSTGQLETALIHFSDYAPSWIDGVTITRIRDRRRLTVGVEPYEVAPELSLQITSPARTVVDLLLSSDPDGYSALAKLMERDARAHDALAAVTRGLGIGARLDAAISAAYAVREGRNHV